MFNYMLLDPQGYNEILQYISLFLLMVIGGMIYYMGANAESMESEIASLETKISNIDFSCPEIPPCPEIPEGKACPVCPTCPAYPTISPVISVEPVESVNSVQPNTPSATVPVECPVTTCPDVRCPTVDDIVSGIFPGRTTGLTNSGVYFDVQGSDNYELLADFEVYRASDAFPDDSILSVPDSLPGNPVISTNFDNSYENYLIDTSLNDDMEVGTGMARGQPGSMTGASSLSPDPTIGLTRPELISMYTELIGVREDSSELISEANIMSLDELRTLVSSYVRYGEEGSAAAQGSQAFGSGTEVNTVPSAEQAAADMASTTATDSDGG